MASGGINLASDQMSIVCKTSRYSSLVSACTRDESVPQNTSLVSSGLLGGIGNDPNFNVNSVLYNSILQPSDFYNTTEGSNEVNPLTGLPYGFFHYPLSGGK